jgi:hypothetical protein
MPPSLRDEEGWAKGNIEKVFHQGDGSMGKSLNSTLVTGDKKFSKLLSLSIISLSIVVEST